MPNKMPSRSHKWALIVMAVVGVLWLWAAPPAWADAIPDPQFVEGDGRDAAPAEVTQVQMASERVVINIQNVDVSSYAPYYPDGLLGALVTADFTLHNPNSQTESIPVGFPLFLGNYDTHGQYPEVWDLKAYVNGAEVPTRAVSIRGQSWAIWDMDMPAGDTRLKVTYSMRALDDGSVARFGYILHTGAPWGGPIGRGDIIVHFPYPAEDLFINVKGTTTGYAVSDFDVRWHFENLEPTTANDILLSVVSPNAWASVAQARKQVIEEKTSDNYINLARAYGGIIENYDPTATNGGLWNFYSPLLAQTAEAQYLKALELDPTNLSLRKELSDFVIKWSGVLLPGKDVAILTQIASTSYPTETGTATSRPLLPPSATHAPNVAISTPQATATLRPVTPNVTARPPNTTVPLAPATVAPSPDTGITTTATPLLIGATFLVILLGLGVALRRRK